jgi:hypothetical protein
VDAGVRGHAPGSPQRGHEDEGDRPVHERPPCPCGPWCGGGGSPSGDVGTTSSIEADGRNVAGRGAGAGAGAVVLAGCAGPGGGKAGLHAPEQSQTIAIVRFVRMRRTLPQ